MSANNTDNDGSNDNGNDDENSHVEDKNKSPPRQLRLEYHLRPQQRHLWRLNRQKRQKCDKHDAYGNKQNVKDDCIPDNDDNQDENKDTHTFSADDYRAEKEKLRLYLDRWRRFVKRQPRRRRDCRNRPDWKSST